MNALSQTHANAAQILKLDTKSFSKILDYLTLEDLYSLAQTCTTIQSSAGQYFQEYFHKPRKIIQKNNISMEYFFVQDKVRTLKFTTVFNPFIGRVEFGVQYGNIDYMRAHANEFHSLKEIVFKHRKLDDQLIASFQAVLPRIEIVNFDGCRVDGDFYEKFLKHFINLKKLSVDYCYGIIDADAGANNWLLQTYPHLEVFELKLKEVHKINELCSFLERNPTIRTFSITSGCLWTNKDELLESTVSIDKLIVDDTVWGEYVHIGALCELLNRLHQQGFYKRLRIEFHCDFKEDLNIEQLATLCGFEEIYIGDWRGNCDFSRLVDLQVLHLSNCVCDMIALATSTVNLEQLILNGADFDDIMPFIERSLKLKRIDIGSYLGDLKLLELNIQRDKVNAADKLTIFIPDYTFLATKWSIPNGDTNLNKIEIKRSSSVVGL